MKKTGKSENEVIKNASIALSYLIHNYNYFRVQTIDAFFQSILRNLARELDLTANLRIDLNDRQVEEYAVEELIESLEQGDKVLDWIREYIDSNISEERNWNIIGEIKKFGMNIFKDFYKEHRKELDDLMKNDKFFNDYRKSLNTRMKIISDDIINKAKEIISILESHDLNDFSYFPYGNRGSILSYIRKLAEGIFDGGATPKRVEDCQNDASKWAKKKTDKTNDLIELAESCLNEKLFIVENTRKTNWKDYKSAELTLLNLDKLRLLHAINIRMTCQFIQPESLIYILRGYHDRRFCNQYGCLWRCRKDCQFLPYSLCKGCSSKNTERNICTKLNREFHQLLLGLAKLIQFIHCQHCNCCICTAASQPCSHRNMFLQSNLNSFLYREVLPHHLGSSENQVIANFS